MNCTESGVRCGKDVEIVGAVRYFDLDATGAAVFNGGGGGGGCYSVVCHRVKVKAAEVCVNEGDECKIVILNSNDLK